MLLKVEFEENAIWNCEFDVNSSNTILQSMSHAVHKYGFIHASEENWSQKKYWSCNIFPIKPKLYHQWQLKLVTMSKRKTLTKRRSVGSNPGSMGTPARDSLMMLSSRQDQKENQQNTRKNRAYQELKREIEHKKKLKEKVRFKKTIKKVAKLI